LFFCARIGVVIAAAFRVGGIGMRRIASLVLAAGAVVGIGSIGSAAPADAGGWCPPRPVVVVYYAPPVCCGPAYVYGGHYYKTTQYWPAVRPYRAVSLYWPIRVRRR
jgi:hypothetical protein